LKIRKYVRSGDLDCVLCHSKYAMDNWGIYCPSSRNYPRTCVGSSLNILDPMFD
jgi:hypothetical protein